MSSSTPAQNTPSDARVVTRAFSLSTVELEIIQLVRAEENFLSDSATVRRLIHDGWKLRTLRKGAELEITEGRSAPNPS